MSYSIYIGNADLDPGSAPPAGEAGVRAQYVARVQPAERPSAPCFPGDPMTGRSNGRYPSYTSWARSMEVAGLSEWMFDRASGILSRHPGCVAINARDLAIVRTALDNWTRSHPGTTPGWCQCVDCEPFGSPSLPHVALDPIGARLLWLEWWIDWALVNCERPAISNS